MDQARQVFEALMQAKGRQPSGWDGKRYENDNMQTYWRYFFLGWTTKGSN